MIFRAAQSLHPLAVPGAGLVDFPGDRRRSHEANGLNVGVFQQAVNGDLVALHYVEDAFGGSGFAHQLRQ